MAAGWALVRVALLPFAPSAIADVGPLLAKIKKTHAEIAEGQRPQRVRGAQAAPQARIGVTSGRKSERHMIEWRSDLWSLVTPIGLASPGRPALRLSSLERVLVVSLRPLPLGDLCESS